MPDREEVFRSLYGAWRLALLDEWGVAYFNLTVEGFWRSFFAAVLVAPGFAILIVQKLAAQLAPFDPGWAMLVQIIAYGLSWVVFPMAGMGLTRLLGLSHNYVPLIIALNWGTVLQVMAFLTVVVIELALPDMLESLVMLLITGGILFYQWFIVRSALQTSGAIALMIVLIDLIINATISIFADHLIV